MKSVRLKYILCILLSLTVISGVILAPQVYFRFVDSGESTRVYRDFIYKDSGEGIESFDEYIRLYEDPSTRVFYVNSTIYAGSYTSLDKSVRLELQRLLSLLSGITCTSGLSSLLSGTDDPVILDCQQVSCIGEIAGEPKSAESIYINYEAKFGTVSVLYNLNCHKIFNVYIYSSEGSLFSTTAEYDYAEIDRAEIQADFFKYLEYSGKCDLNITAASDYFCIELEPPAYTSDRSVEQENK